MNTKQKWEEMTPEEKRSNVNAFVINTTLLEINPTTQNLFYLNKEYYIKGLLYVIFKVTRDENRDITFYFSKQI